MRALSPPSLLSLGLFALTACGSAPPPLELPKLVVRKNWLPGLPQEGAKIGASKIEIPKDQVYEVRIVGWLLSKPVPGRFVPVSECTQLILALAGEQPVLPSSPLTGDGQVAVGPGALEAQSFLEIGGAKAAVQLLDDRGILPRGLTIEFEVGLENAAAEAARSRRTLSFCVSRAADDRLTVSILSRMTEPTQHGLSTLTRNEILVLDRAPEPGKSPMFLRWKARVARLKSQDVGIYIQVQSRVGWGLEKALAQCEESLRKQGRDAAAMGSALSPRETQEIDLASALESLALVSKRRAMLVHQAQKSHADLALDLGLSGDDQLLATYFLRVVPLLKAQEPAELTPDELAWILEREAWHQLLLSLEEQPPQPEIVALAMRHAGEIANYTGMLGTLVDDSKSLQQFQQDLLMENRSILSSNMPGPRIRAFLWLQGRGEDLMTYDPMADAKERRKAFVALVRKWESEAKQK